jgi:hypothetical protein
MAKDNRPDEPEDSSGSFDESDDTFGLPEIEYEPIKREEEPAPEPTPRPWEEERKEEVVEPVASEPVREEHTYEPPRYEEPPRAQYSYSYSHETESPVWPKVVGILLLLAILVGGGLWYFLKYKPARDEEARLEAARQAAADEAFRRDRARADSLAEIERQRVRRINDSLARIPPKPAAGTIDTLTGRTGRYYVIVASNIDDDLLMDYARKLSAAGVSSKLIPPHGRVKFYRLAIAEGDTYASAQATADGMKADYGQDLWVTRY